MATIKSYTDISQSKTLSKILSLESADMYYSPVPVREWKDKEDKSKGTHVVFKDQIFVLKNLSNGQIGEGDIYAWSLAALLGVLPQGEYKDTDLCCGGYEGDKYIPEWFCSYEQQEPFIIEICHADNPIDACYELILKLNELNLL